ncbi:MAG: hypothetical protein ACM3X6_11240 [Patescibacteria group bacterium]
MPRKHLFKLIALILPATVIIACGPLTIGVAAAATLDLTTRPQIWFGPLPPMETHSGRPFIGSDDFMDLFTASAPWDKAASRVRVFELFGEWVSEDATDAELRRVVADLNRRGIPIAVQVGPLNPTDAYGRGVEGFAGIQEGFRIARRIKQAGGTISFVDFDEPFFFASIYDGPQSTRWSAEKVAAEVAEYVEAVRTVFPQAAFGGSEPLLREPYVKTADLKKWIDAYQAAAGMPLAFLHLDLDYTRKDWPRAAKELEDFCRSRGVAFGLYYLGDAIDPTDEAWLSHAGERVKTYELAAGGDPDHVVFMSWHDRPDRVLPETAPYTFTWFINTYFEDKAALGIRTAGVGANLAYKKPAKASRSLGENPAANAVDGNSETWWARAITRRSG